VRCVRVWVGGWVGGWGGGGGQLWVRGVVADRTGVGSVVLVYGSPVVNGTDQEGTLVVALDVAGVHTRGCTAADYEDWAGPPGADGQERCILGRKVRAHLQSSRA
jgi:hypothetical protein